MIKCHRSKMGVIYMQSWKQCLLPFSWLSLQWPCGNWCFWAHDVRHIIYMYVFIHIYTTNTHIHTYILFLYLSITYILTIIVKTQMLFFIVLKKEISVFFFLVTCYIVETDSKCLLLSWKSYYRNECYCKVS